LAQLVEEIVVLEVPSDSFPGMEHLSGYDLVFVSERKASSLVVADKSVMIASRTKKSASPIVRIPPHSEAKAAIWA